MAEIKTPSGRERLKAAVAKDCTKCGSAFNTAGCAPLGNPDCNNGYCSKYAWVLSRATNYADALGLSVDEVLDRWEDNRDYWYMNYYQDCHQPRIEEPGVVLFTDWVAQLKRNHGVNPHGWAFTCPMCHHVQTMADFIAIGQDGNCAYVECIGRYKKGVGCDWAAYGLFKVTKTKVIKDAVAYDVFEIAAPIEKAQDQAQAEI